MKTIITTLLALIVLGNTLYAESEKKVTSKIEGVTVFLQGAQIERKGKFQIQKGITKVIFEGMTQQFDQNSIQVKGKGSFIILDVSSSIFYPQPELIKPLEMPEKILREINLLNDSIDDKSWILQDLQSQLEAYKNERNLLMNSGVIKGQGDNDSIAALKDAMDYLRIKISELNKLLLQAERKSQKEKASLNRMNARLAELRNYNQNVGNIYKTQQPVQQIIVTVSADAETYGSLTLKYMVPNAGWSPAYDLRADDINSPVKLTYKANVYQNTGVNWEDVNVKLSTINPNQSNNKPTLAVWYVNYYQPIQNYDRYSGGQPQYKKDLDMDESMAIPSSIAQNEISLDAIDAQHVSNYTEMSENMAMVEFELKIPYTINSDGKQHLMAIGSEEIDASFQYHIVPKMDKDAFLVARLTNWEDLNLLPAVANIYYDGTYVGQTRINPSIMSDTLELALGRDRGVFLTRKKINDEEKIKKLTGEKEKTITYELAIKNYKSGAINIIIEDQIPVSLNEEIKVELIEKGIAEYNEKTGKLQWKVDVSSKETKKYEFTYSLRFDKDKTLALN